MAKSNLYVYLARLDKKGIKVISAFAFDQKVYATRINDVDKLNLNPQIGSAIAKEAYDNRMQYELFIESADSFDDLKSSLRKRGYSHLPISQFSGYVPSTYINKEALVTKSSTMLRRNSDIKR
jgi:hypothetical protein